MGRNRAQRRAAEKAFQSTHPVWDGTYPPYIGLNTLDISIHPSRVGWDRGQGTTTPEFIHFNPPIPCGMGQFFLARLFCLVRNFNPPIPCGMGLPFPPMLIPMFLFQSTHPVWDGTRQRGLLSANNGISIHPSRVGWDFLGDEKQADAMIFQSTHPVWDATRLPEHIHPELLISLLPSRVGWDIARQRFRLVLEHFNPPIPCGMGLQQTSHGREAGVFQSTHPVWDGTYPAPFTLIYMKISIHPSRVGWDQSSSPRCRDIQGFQSTHPVWDGTVRIAVIDQGQDDFNPPIPCGMGPHIWT